MHLVKKIQLPTNKETFNAALFFFLVVIILMIDISLAFQRHLHQLSTTVEGTMLPHPNSPYTELVFEVSMKVSLIFLLVLLPIMTELHFNSRGGTRLINLFYEACMLVICWLSLFLLFLRTLIVQFLNVEIVWMIFMIAVLVKLENSGWLGFFRRWVKRKFSK